MFSLFVAPKHVRVSGGAVASQFASSSDGPSSNPADNSLCLLGQIELEPNLVVRF